MSDLPNPTEMRGNWNELKGMLMQQYAHLIDDDLLYAEGKKDEMLGRLQVKLGKTKEELQDIITSLEDTLHDATTSGGKAL